MQLGALEKNSEPLLITYLFLGLCLIDVVSADLDAGLEEGAGELGYGKTQQVAHLLRHCVVWECGLVRVALFLKRHVTKLQHCRNRLVNS